APTGIYAGGTIQIYRNLSTDPSTFYHIGSANAGDSFVDNAPDSAITDTTAPNYKVLDLDGPKITNNTLLVDVISRNGSTYDHPFDVGTLDFTGHKGGAALSTQTLDITSTTTVQDLVNFMNQSMGIQQPAADPQNPIPIDASGTPPGGSVITGGKLQFVSNNGTDSAIDIPLTSFKLTTASGTTTPNLGFGVTQTAIGAGAATDLVAYDSLGVPVNVHVTVELESETSNSTVYRWYADSPDNKGGNGISVGTGLIKFDGTGSVFNVTNDKVDINRTGTAALSPLEFQLDFTKLSGLAGTSNSLAASSQDGSGAGTLSSYTIGQDGTIRGNFSNGVTRTLGQVVLARFGNPDGLQQVGNNLYTSGPNSGLAVVGVPGQQGIGTITAGAVELSNSDIGQNLINLILASTAYSGNTRVITTTQQLFQELLQLNR
ncbi:MAG TPA: flagellar hook-basal body complex protein, partial [Pirellulales bacterium]|nr:flagellar hook-basal body complex protein [Pirellulales bacterium]